MRQMFSKYLFSSLNTITDIQIRFRHIINNLQAHTMKTDLKICIDK